MANERDTCKDDDCDWVTYKRLVLANLGELKREDEKQETKFDALCAKNAKDIADTNGQVLILNVKSGMWGALGGLIPILLLLLYEAIKMSSRIPNAVPTIVP